MQSTLRRTISVAHWLSSSQNASVARQHPRMRHEAAVLLALYLGECKSFRTSLRLLVVNGAIRTTIGGTRVKATGVLLTHMERPISKDSPSKLNRHLSTMARAHLAPGIPVLVRTCLSNTEDIKLLSKAVTPAHLRSRFRA